MSTFRFDREDLLPVAADLASTYAQAVPFPHVVIDNFLPDDLIHQLAEVFPEPTQDWYRFDSVVERKYSLRDEALIPGPLVQFIHELNGQVFVEFLELLTGITGLVPDPHLEGGGLHQIAEGGVLKVHADFNKHVRLALDRRLNAILYLNPDWDEEFGGHLELWDQQLTEPTVRVLPILNRLVVFSTTSTSYHGHPEPLTPPAGRCRRSIAMYYYTAPVRRLRVSHPTRFQKRPGSEDVVPPIPGPLGRYVRAVIRDHAPAPVFNALRRLRNRAARSR